jgi:hypothetical protein
VDATVTSSAVVASASGEHATPVAVVVTLVLIRAGDRVADRSHECDGRQLRSPGC